MMAFPNWIIRLIKGKRRPPLIVAMLHANSEDVNYEIYSQCYGLEMQINDEWNAQLVLLAPYENFHVVVEDTDVTGEDTAIVSAGVVDLPAKPGGGFDTSAVERERDNWVLIGDPRAEGDDPAFNAKLVAALNSGCRVMVCLKHLDRGTIAKRLSPLKQVDGSRIVIVLASGEAMKPSTAKQACQAIHEQIGNTCTVIVAGKVNPATIQRVLSHDGIDGVLLTDRHYAEFGHLLKLLKTVGG